MYRAGEVSVRRACCERAIVAIFSVGGGKQLSERMGRPLYIAKFHIIRFPGVRGQTTISVGKNQQAGSHSLFPRWGRGTAIRAGGNTRFPGGG